MMYCQTESHFLIFNMLFTATDYFILIHNKSTELFACNHGDIDNGSAVISVLFFELFCGI